MKVLLTGAGGFLGQAVVRALLSSEGTPLEVVAHIGPHGCSPPAVEGLHSSFCCDITDSETLSQHLVGVEVVIHLAGPPSVAASFKDPVSAVEAHVVGTATVLAASAAAGVRHLVYISSAEVYGQPLTAVVSESSPLRPRSPYGAAKVGSEALVRATTAEGRMTATVLRPFSVYGPRPVQPGVIGVIVRQLKNERVVLQKPDAVRDFCFVDDVANAIVCAALHGEPAPFSVFNVGGGSGTSIETVAKHLLHAIGRDSTPVEALGSEGDRPKAADIHSLVSDIASISSELGWQPQTAMAEGMKLILMESI
jgi:nucleoside-diphosphate-sugar epimerase